MSSPSVAVTPTAPAGLRAFVGWWPLLLLLAAAVALYVFGASYVLNLNTLRESQAWMERAVVIHPLLAGLVFVTATAVYLLLSLPAEGLLTAVGGMLFGTLLGSTLSILGTVLAALTLFYALRGMLRRQLAITHSPAVERVRQRMERDGVNYLLMLRLLPVLPFAMVSLLAVLVRMRARPYTLATAIGVIPPAVVFTSVGTGLGTLLAKREKLDLSNLLSGQILLPLIGLAILALLPVARRIWQDRIGRRQSRGCCP